MGRRRSGGWFRYRSGLPLHSTGRFTCERNSLEGTDLRVTLLIVLQQIYYSCAVTSHHLLPPLCHSHWKAYAKEKYYLPSDETHEQQAEQRSSKQGLCSLQSASLSIMAVDIRSLLEASNSTLSSSRSIMRSLVSRSRRMMMDDQVRFDILIVGN